MYLAKVNILHGEKDQAIIPGFKARTPEFWLTVTFNARETEIFEINNFTVCLRNMEGFFHGFFSL